MTTPLNESFALVLFNNNYFAWLFKGKKNYATVLTDYNKEDQVEGKGTLVEFLLQKGYIDLNSQPEDICCFVAPPTGQPRLDQQWLNFDTQDKIKKYELVKNQFRDNLQRLQTEARTSKEYEQVQAALETVETLENDTHDDIQKARKKRRLIKDLKEYTGARKGKEKAFRGWSTRAFREMITTKRAS